MREQTARSMYLKELGGSLVLYAIVLFTAVGVARGMPEGTLRTAILVSPMLPFLLAVWAVFRGLRRSDEFIRLIALENIGIAAAVTAGWTFTYGFLETAGFPRLSMFTVWPVMGAVWGIAQCFARLRNR